MCRRDDAAGREPAASTRKLLSQMTRSCLALSTRLGPGMAPRFDLAPVRSGDGAAGWCCVVVQDGVVPGEVPTYDVAFDDLAGVLLEESYVLSIEERDDAVEFSLDAVLTPSHPAYRPPGPNEQYCYWRGLLVVASVERPRLRRSGGPPATDATSEQDLGNIDSLIAVDADSRDLWAMGGCWGELKRLNRTLASSFQTPELERRCRPWARR